MLYKLSRLVAALTVLSLIVFFACRRNDLLPGGRDKNKAITDPSVELDVQLARRYYKNLRTDQGIDVGEAHVPGRNRTLSNTKHPIWSRALSSETPVAWIVEVPLFYNQRPASIVMPQDKKLDAATRLKLLNASFDRLVIFKNKKTGKVDNRILTYMPDIEYLNRHGKDISNNSIGTMDKDFSGTLIYRKWDGTNLFARKFVDGKVVKKFSAEKRAHDAAVRKAKGNAAAREVCTTYCDQTWEQTCYVTIAGEFITEECGEWQLVSEFCWDECYDDGSDDDWYTGDPCIDYGDCGTPGYPPPSPTDPDYEVFLANGDKPLAEYPTKCAGAQGIWNMSIQNNKEVIGVLTSDDKFMAVAMVGYSGGSWSGLYENNGQLYYRYPESQGAPTQNYAGMIQRDGNYLIPLKATIHTHNPCRQDGTDGISDTILSSGDKSLAKNFKSGKHYIIGCDAIGKFDHTSDEPTVIDSGSLSSTCSSIQ